LHAGRRPVEQRQVAFAPACGDGFEATRHLYSREVRKPFADASGANIGDPRVLRRCSSNSEASIPPIRPRWRRASRDAGPCGTGSIADVRPAAARLT
jgi:hypothetical protein